MHTEHLQKEKPMVLEKQLLSVTDMEAQTALELPNREMLLVTVIITNVLNNLSIEIPVQNNNVAAQVCLAVGSINALLVDQGVSLASLTCAIDQK
jgi:hypothetical protein